MIEIWFAAELLRKKEEEYWAAVKEEKAKKAELLKLHSKLYFFIFKVQDSFLKLIHITIKCMQLKKCDCTSYFQESTFSFGYKLRVNYHL